jgi:hypothetical protein
VAGAEVEVGEAADGVVAAAAHAQVDHHAVLDARPPVGVDAVLQPHRRLGEAAAGVGQRPRAAEDVLAQEQVVAVEEEQQLARRGGHAGIAGGAGAAGAVAAHHGAAGLAGGPVAEEGGGAVGRAVVHDDDLGVAGAEVGGGGGVAGQGVLDAAQGPAEDGGVVVGGDDDGEGRHNALHTGTGRRRPQPGGEQTLRSLATACPGRVAPRGRGAAARPARRHQ